MGKSITSNDIMQYHGTNCRRAYVRMLQMAHNDGVNVRLNSGYRSFVQQVKLYALYKAGRGPLAARPGTSTHNRKDWQQGLDIDHYWGSGVQSFVNWARRQGMNFRFTVPGENWHVNAEHNYDAHINAMWHKRGH